MKNKVTATIIDKILNDNTFSMELAKRLMLQQQSVKALARRNSKNLTLYDAVNFYKENGFGDDDIFAIEIDTNTKEILKH